MLAPDRRSSVERRCSGTAGAIPLAPLYAARALETDGCWPALLHPPVRRSPTTVTSPEPDLPWRWPWPRALHPRPRHHRRRHPPASPSAIAIAGTGLPSRVRRAARDPRRPRYLQIRYLGANGGAPITAPATGNGVGFPLMPRRSSLGSEPPHPRYLRCRRHSPGRHRRPRLAPEGRSRVQRAIVTAEGIRVGRHGLPSPAGRPRIASIVNRVRAVIALDSHDVRTTPPALTIMTASDAAPVINARAKIER